MGQGLDLLNRQWEELEQKEVVDQLRLLPSESLSKKADRLVDLINLLVLQGFGAQDYTTALQSELDQIVFLLREREESKKVS